MVEDQRQTTDQANVENAVSLKFDVKHCSFRYSKSHETISNSGAGESFDGSVDSVSSPEFDHN